MAVAVRAARLPQLPCRSLPEHSYAKLKQRDDKSLVLTFLDWASVPLSGLNVPVLCWFLDAGNDETLGRLSWPASKKRQCTKSREVWHPAVQRVLWGSYVGGGLDGGRGASTRRRACAHAGEPGRVQWTSRRAYGIHQWSVAELMGGIGSRGGKPHGRMLPRWS